MAVPKWYTLAEKEIGFHERPGNRGLAKYIALAHTGSEGDPWCAIFVNAMLEKAGVPGSRSAMARSFESSKNFVKIKAPSLGCIVTMWRGSRASGKGHVFFYAGTLATGDYLALGGNQSDQVRKQREPKGRVVGCYWPKSVPLPTSGPFKVNASGIPAGKET